MSYKIDTVAISHIKNEISDYRVAAMLSLVGVFFLTTPILAAGKLLGWIDITWKTTLLPVAFAVFALGVIVCCALVISLTTSVAGIIFNKRTIRYILRGEE